MTEDGTKMNGSTTVQVTKPQLQAANCEWTLVAVPSDEIVDVDVQAWMYFQVR